MSFSVGDVPSDAGRKSGSGSRIFAEGVGTFDLLESQTTVNITALVADIQVRQRFRNPFPAPTTASYVTALPDCTTVTMFSALTGSITLVSFERSHLSRPVANRSEARVRVLHGGEDAATFTYPVGVVAAGEEVLVDVHFLTTISFRAGIAALWFPWLGPYGREAERADSYDVSGAIRVSVDPAGLQFATFRSNAAVLLHETWHPPGLEHSYGETPLSFVAAPAGDDEGFSLELVGAGDEHQGSLTYLPEPGDADIGTYIATLLPAIHPSPPPPLAITIVLDRSVTMKGWRIAAGRRGLTTLLRCLNPHDQFAVVAFNHDVFRPRGVATFGKMSPADGASRCRAIESTSWLEAEGGIELLPALLDGLSAFPPPDSGFASACVVVTGGFFGKYDEGLWADIQRRAAGRRIFCVSLADGTGELTERRLGELVAQPIYRAHEFADAASAFSAIARDLRVPVLRDVTIRPPEGFSFTPTVGQEVDAFYDPYIQVGQYARSGPGIGDNGLGDVAIAAIDSAGAPVRLAVPARMALSEGVRHLLEREDALTRDLPHSRNAVIT